MMLTAKAVIQTEHASRYLARLRGHIGKMGPHLGSRLAARGSRHAPPEVRHAEWSDTGGAVTLNWGQWAAEATAGTLKLRAAAADAENLRRIQGMLATRLENFGRREHLTVIWQPAGTTAAQPGQPG